MAADAGREVTGHLRVEARAKGRVSVAKYVRADGGESREVLGAAWVKDSGRKTPRGATVWRAPDGRKPDGFLTPKEALQEVLAAERRPPGRRSARAGPKSFGEALASYLESLDVEK